MVILQNSRLPSLLQYVGWQLASLFIWDVFVVIMYTLYADDIGVRLPALPVTLFGSALVLFLSLRNNAAYARWWEARTLWGAVVNSSRSFAREALTLIADTPESRELRRTLVIRQIAYASALRLHLLKKRSPDMLANIDGLDIEEQRHLTAHTNVPNAILTRHGQDVSEAWRAGWMNRFDRVRLESTMVDLSNAQGGLERICNTPLPKQYAQYPKLFVSAFCVIMPLGLVDSLGIYTPLASTLVGFMLMTMEKMGHDLQDPFSNNVHDVPMASICRTIQIDLLESIGDRAPSPAKSVKGVLW
ncbi:membrane protein [Robbsia andropogonis]|uniref:Membrane protein n=1 Tax=Robbsia andropogonis TaxID=28092 RepID=A0A0F5JXF4_9BURK|nr:bestrophin family ion channel [Robbsia andropogonis]KKB62526.1 membrane protein [Robbsia andropogonis]MCP1120172.1 hypothetical protein [Robbsia andropogonis]MCP1129996.1 hypothetical protein [Robbsia andropogonis]